MVNVKEMLKSIINVDSLLKTSTLAMNVFVKVLITHIGT